MCLSPADEGVQAPGGDLQTSPRHTLRTCMAVADPVLPVVPP